MSLVVEDGTGLSTAEAYISVADADTFFAAEPRGTEWAALTTSQKEQALRAAARILDLECQWIGFPVSETQALAWPRSNARREDPVTYVIETGFANLVSGFYYAETDVPLNVKRANSLMAMATIRQDRYPLAEQSRTSGVSTAKGSRSYSRQDGVGGQVLPLEVQSCVRRLCNTSSRPLRRVA